MFFSDFLSLTLILYANHCINFSILHKDHILLLVSQGHVCYFLNLIQVYNSYGNLLFLCEHQWLNMCHHPPLRGQDHHYFLQMSYVYSLKSIFIIKIMLIFTNKIADSTIIYFFPNIQKYLLFYLYFLKNHNLS